MSTPGSVLRKLLLSHSISSAWCSLLGSLGLGTWMQAGTLKAISTDGEMAMELHARVTGSRLVIGRSRHTDDGPTLMPEIVVDPTATLDQLRALIGHLQRDTHPSPQGEQHVPA